jgi:hypothetical protein
VQAYSRWFGVDLECAVTELQFLGVELDANYIQALRASLEGQRHAKTAVNAGASVSGFERPGDEQFAFIAGTTAAGFAFGVTWEERAVAEAEDGAA